MKLLHIYAGNLFGGIETLLVTLAKNRGLCEKMQHDFALCFEGKLAKELRAGGATVHILGEVRTRQPWTVWKARRQLDQLLGQESFDRVICHACWPQAIFGPVVRMRRLPLIFWCHDTPGSGHWIEHWAKQTVPALAIANSRYTLAALPKLYAGIRHQLFYYPVVEPDLGDRMTRSSIRANFNTPDDAVVMIQASRLEPWKGQTMLLSALALLRDRSNWVCWIAGGAQRPHETEYLQKLQAQANELGIADRLRFLGQRDDVPNLLAAADIYCQPNIRPEPFGIAFIEALYAGLPVVTTAMGAAVEIVNQSCGRLVAPHNAIALSQVLDALIMQPDFRSGLAAAAPAWAKHLCAPAQQLMQLYQLLSEVVIQEAVA